MVSLHDGIHSKKSWRCTQFCVNIGEPRLLKSHGFLCLQAYPDGKGVAACPEWNGLTTDYKILITTSTRREVVIALRHFPNISDKYRSLPSRVLLRTHHLRHHLPPSYRPHQSCCPHPRDAVAVVTARWRWWSSPRSDSPHHRCPWAVMTTASALPRCLQTQ